MIKKIFFLLFACALAFGALSVPAAAQTYSSHNGCLSQPILWYYPDPIPFGFFYYGPGQGPYSYRISSWSYKCPPPNAGNETCPHCPSAGKPISLTTGTTYIEQTDVRIRGLANGLNLVRTWLSIWPASQAASQVGLFGPNWRSTYEERIFTGDDGYTKYARGDGSFWSFGFDQAAGVMRVAAPANVIATLTKDTSSWTLVFQNGEVRHFDPSTGNLASIIDRNGNTIQLAYDSASRLATVTDAASRRLNFSYATSSSKLITAVTSDVGISLSYAYDASGNLTRVTKPDLTTVSFVYNAQSLITSVLDSNGRVLESHTYDLNARGLSSSLAQGVESLTVSYPQ